MAHSCPSSDQLQQFLLGQLSATQSETIAAHLDTCQACEELLTAIESEQPAFSSDLRDGLRFHHLLKEPEFQVLCATVTSSESTEESYSEVDTPSSSMRQLRDYRLVRKIGEGGMGTVYQAVHVHLGKAVALKILPQDKLRSSQTVQRFKREMRAVGKVNHPNIVSASDAGSVDGLHYLVMELVEGADLARIMKEHGVLSIANACEIVRQAALGLQHAHDHGLVHRDVKPSNLMLTINGDIKVLDLGLAGLNNTTMEKSANVVVSSRLTSVGQIMGTLDFMAPEQIKASTKVDSRADVYALGTTLFYLLGGKPPCGDRSQDIPERIRAVLHDDPIKISTLRPETPALLINLLKRMLAKAPIDRPATAHDVASELESFADSADLQSLAETCRTSLAIPSADVDITDDVSLIVTRTESEVVEAQALAPERRTPVWFKSLIALALCGIMISLAVIILRTEKGMVRVEIPDNLPDREEFHIQLEKNGQSHTISNATKDWTIRLAEGTYDLDLHSDDHRLSLEGNSLVVQSGLMTILKVNYTPDPQAVPEEKIGAPKDGKRLPEDVLTETGDLKLARDLVVQEVQEYPDQGWSHGKAAMIFALHDYGQDALIPKSYQDERTWLITRWLKTGEGTNTIPRICCIYPGEIPHLEAMLIAIKREEEAHPQDWRLPHSRMMVNYRLGSYEDALAAFHQCRKISPKNPMHVAVDHAWSALILAKLNRHAEAEKDRNKAMTLMNELTLKKERGFPNQWFDAVELLLILQELATIEMPPPTMTPPQDVIQSVPYSLCPEDMQLAKVRFSSDSISDAQLSRDGKLLAAALGWRPGKWEFWDLAAMSEDELLVDDNSVLRYTGGQPLRSICLHPTLPIAALGRWYGAVDVVNIEDNKILATKVTSIGKLRKANGVRFTSDGSTLVIGYQSNRVVAWDWEHDVEVAQQTFPTPAWQINLSLDDSEVLVGWQVWNWRTNELRSFIDPDTDENAKSPAGSWSPDGRYILRSTGDKLNLYDARSGELSHSYAFDKTIERSVYLPNSKRIILALQGGELRLLDAHTEQSVTLGYVHPNHQLWNLETSADGKWLLTTTGHRRDKSLRESHRIAIWRLSPSLQKSSIETIRARQVDEESQRLKFEAMIQSEKTTKD